MKYDIIIIGSGPGGYVAAIRAAQLGLKTAIVERSKLGGICLNWGCIPIKALLKSAQVYNYLSHSSDYGIQIDGEIKVDFKSIIDRSRTIADGMSRGVEFLLKKHKVDHIRGFGKVKPGKLVEVKDAEGNISNFSTKHIIIATGARSREFPNLKQDGRRIIGYKEAMTLPEQPKSMIIVGSGAIGAEFAYFYNTIGTQVTLVEMVPNIVPFEDEEVSKQLARSFKKSKIIVKTASSLESVEITDKGCQALVQTKKGEEIIEADIILSAVGVQTNIENIGLEETGIETNKGKIVVDEFYKTSVDGYFAIGDIIPGPELAHLASHEAIVCVEKIAAMKPEPIDYGNISACTYTNPEIASVGLTEAQAIEKDYKIKIGKFPFMASGKANASGSRDGFVKIIIDADNDLILGAHLIGENVTEMISEIVVARKMNIKGHDILHSIHPHPTMSEAIMEAVANAYGEAIHVL
ncbi:MAG: dihydrolipoyl dehydrogenase [Bacteroidales bacterium]|nr:dihydrolipoyl dehydrogenase [Bacteroidales bacterium]